ncbi:MAG: ABC transporter ATP-binding protein, partial [Lachnospiraceae bacterium]|nr:ABC transporter ATP-binding protein [Lachnospiraceae bacterium]
CLYQTDYLEKKDGRIAYDSGSGQGNAAIRAAASAPSDTKQDWKAQKEQQAAQRKKENALKKCEESIEKLEQRNTQIDLLMASPEVCTDVARLQELAKEKETNETALNELYEKWEQLSE